MAFLKEAKDRWQGRKAARPMATWSQRDHNAIFCSPKWLQHWSIWCSHIYGHIRDLQLVRKLQHIDAPLKWTQRNTAWHCWKTTAGFLSAFAVQNGDLPSSQALCSWNLEGLSQHSFPCSLRSLTLVLKAASCNVAVGLGISWDDSLMAELCLLRRLSS